MTPSNITSLQRVLTTLGHQEPDRIPFFLLVTMHGAKELGMSIKEYFSKAENVVEGQLRMRDKYRHDCIYAFFHAPIEMEAWGGEVIYSENGPPNSGEPLIHKFGDINNMTPPKVKDAPCLLKVLKTIEMLKNKVREEVPIIGVVISPFSLPIMQIGFDKYIELIYEQPKLFEHLMKLNELFCVEWANAQLSAGATAICYFDPVSSTTIIPRNLYLTTGFKIAKRTIAQIKGPTATHMASGRCLPIIDDIAQTGTAIICTSVIEDLAEVKSICQKKIAVLGNLNGIEMRRWTSEQAETFVKDAIAKGGPGGGYILSDNHGEIPWQVPEEVLMAISEAVHKWGQYPLDWTTIENS
ncbi:uroporphyrinogen decarboxylase family protein [Desulfobacterales bacterium HSG16]|nr:uroporphyrinogen decarboxylase family protein [Desulfobacterales bacterium HSG16]